MKQIKDYVEVMFKELPQTKEVLAIKANILDSMEDKYLELIASGMIESQAIGQVIGEFGSIDEIKEALDLEETDVQMYDSKFVDDFLNFIPEFSRYIAIGVASIIFGMALITLSEHTKFEPIATVGFFACIAFAVTLFITFGLKYSRFKFSKEKHLSNRDKDKVSLFEAEHQKRLAPMVATGVVILLLGIACEYLLDEYQIQGVGNGFVFLITAMIGVYLFIVSGVNTTLPGQFDGFESQTDEEKKSEKRWGEITGALMGITAMVYVALGLWRGELFGILWILFPVVALCMELVKAISRK